MCRESGTAVPESVQSTSGIPSNMARVWQQRQSGVVTVMNSPGAGLLVSQGGLAHNSLTVSKC